MARAFQAPAAREAVSDRPPPRRGGGFDLSPNGMLGLQRTAGNAATTRMLQRLVNEAAVRAEAERLWMRKGKPDQTAQQSTADWDLATRNVGETEAEARRLWEAKGSPAQSDVDQQRDWAAAAHTVRQRRLAEDAWRAKGAPQNQGAAGEAADWALAGTQLGIEEAWEQCNPDVLLPGETAAMVPLRVQAAKNALVAAGFLLNMVEALLGYDHARSPRPFTTVAAEDAYGLGGHIQAKHVRAAANSADDERRKQAMRVATHQAAYGGACPGKAGSFASVADANATIGAALKALWSQNGGWGAPDGWRNKLARGQGFQGALSVPVTINGFVQEKNPHNNQKYPEAQRPWYLGGAAVGGRALYPGDPLLAGGPPGPAAPVGLALDHANPLTVNVVPTQVTIRVVLVPNPAPAAAGAAKGWYVNSAWPQ
jgi:hypothetical protein